MMTFKQYRSLTKTTSQYCLRISGIIFSVCFCVIYSLTEASSVSLLNAVLMFVACILLGNLFAVFIWLLAISSSFAKVKRAYKIIDEIPQDIINYYSITLVFTNKDIRYNYPDCIVKGHKDGHKILLHSSNSHVFITLLNYSKNLVLEKLKFDRKYRKENIELLGFGFAKKTKRKDWHKITKYDFDERIRRLIEITQTEDPYYSEKISQ